MLFLIIIVFGSFTAKAQETVDNTQYDQIPETLVAGFSTLRGNNNSIEYYIANILRDIRDLSQDSSALQTSDIDKVKDRIRASLIARQLQGVMQFDLDFDGNVTRKELEKFYSSPVNLQLVNNVLISSQLQGNSALRPVEKVMTLDSNKDDIITADEMCILPESEEIYKLDLGSAQQIEKMQSLLALDPDKDGKLTIVELDKLARDTFAIVDLDHNSIISTEELNAFIATRGKNLRSQKIGGNIASESALVPVEAQVQANPALDWSETDLPAKGDKVIMVTTNQGGAYSDVSIVGQSAITNSAKIIIQEGSEPLFLFLISNKPIIWQISGSTSRINKVITHVNNNAVTGILKDKIRYHPLPIFQGNNNPFQYIYEGTNANKGTTRFSSTAANARMLGLIGTSPDASYGEYVLDSIELPSGNVPNKRPGDIAKLVQEGFDPSSPEGVTTTDPKTVVSNTPAVKYAVLPGRAGIAQLLAVGALQKMGYKRYKIIKPIQAFPVGLTGELAVKFLLAKGIALPSGNAGQSCIVSEDTQTVISQIKDFCK